MVIMRWKGGKLCACVFVNVYVCLVAAACGGQKKESNNGLEGRRLAFKALLRFPSSATFSLSLWYTPIHTALVVVGSFSPGFPHLIASQFWTVWQRDPIAEEKLRQCVAADVTVLPLCP